MNFRGWSAALAAILVVAGTSVVASAAASVITNGDFETGTLAGWTAANNGAGSWRATTTGASGCIGPTRTPKGTTAALFDMNNPSSGILTQQFTVPSNATLSVDYAYRNWWNAWRQLGGNPFQVGGGVQNQWLRIDVIRSSAAVTTLDPNDILATVFDSQSGSPTFDQDWTTGTVSLAAFAGQTAVFRVATVVDLTCFPTWIDNVNVTGTTGSGTHVGYCSVAGNTHPFTGAAITPGTFLTLDLGQPDRDPHYTGATPGSFVEGKGITCDPPPPGYTQHGFAGNAQQVPAGVYPYYSTG